MTNQTKVTLPKEVAEAIEEIRSAGFTDYAIVTGTDEFTFKPPGYPQSASKEIADWAGGGNHDTLMSALVNGYEVEQSPHETLREYYELACKGAEQRAHDIGLRNGIENTLMILGITVEGIND